jgi:GPH family glycoside/pentoside/hexuronide:cation symporter
MPVWRAALIVLACTFIPLFFAKSLITAIIFAAFIGLGFAGVITTMDLIGAKIMDEDTQKYHLRREGIIANALGFMGRLSGLFTSAAYLLVNKLYGFVSGEQPGAHPDSAARFLMTIVPPILMVISFAFSWFINFKKPVEVPAEPRAA